MPDLANVLATIYPDKPSTERVIREIGLDPGHVDLEGSAQSRWSAVVAHARAKRRFAALILLVAREYPDYAPLKAAVDADLARLDLASPPATGLLPEIVYEAAIGAKPDMDVDALRRLAAVEQVIERHEQALKELQQVVDPVPRRIVGRVVASALALVVTMAWVSYFVNESYQVYTIAPIPAVVFSISLLLVAGLLLWLSGST